MEGFFCYLRRDQARHEADRCQADSAFYVSAFGWDAVWACKNDLKQLCELRDLSDVLTGPVAAVHHATRWKMNSRRSSKKMGASGARGPGGGRRRRGADERGRALGRMRRKPTRVVMPRKRTRSETNGLMA